jgi:hypothetical protein
VLNIATFDLIFPTFSKREKLTLKSFAYELMGLTSYICSARANVYLWTITDQFSASAEQIDATV